ncbi:MAG: thioredoxin family protein [Spirochaetales bacterium]|nr:thioredoxin family protein [Spirochaetales bacterium]
MKLSILAIILILGLIVVVSGFSSGPKENETTGSMKGSPADATNRQVEMVQDEPGGEIASGGIVAFSTLENAQRAAEKGPVVLFFNAAWCPTCRTALADIASRREELGDITVILVDYDKERELKRRYAVTSQHTYVHIDESGGVMSLWNGGGVDMLLRNIGSTGAG